MLREEWFKRLSDEDIAFIRHFVLSSGSLKALASDYHVSYPTIRQKLDRLIEKIGLIESEQTMSSFEQTLRMMLVDGDIDGAGLRRLLNAHQRTVENPSDSASS